MYKHVRTVEDADQLQTSEVDQINPIPSPIRSSDVWRLHQGIELQTSEEVLSSGNNAAKKSCPHSNVSTSSWLIYYQRRTLAFSAAGWIPGVLLREQRSTGRVRAFLACNFRRL